MSKPDLDTVMARRAAVTRELSTIERMRAEIEAENEELQIAERALKRLAALEPEAPGQ